MVIEGVEFLKDEMVKAESVAREMNTRAYFEAKMLCNEKGAVIFPVSQFHRDVKREWLSYEETGGSTHNEAVAVILKPGLVEIRRHEHFRPARVQNIVDSLFSDPKLAFMKEWKVTYGGKDLIRSF